MRQVWIARKGPPEVLQLREAPDPQPGPGQVRIRVAAAGVNFADLMMRLGLYPDAPPLPAVPGYEVSGTIDAAGPGADPALLGRPALAAIRFGGYADAVCVPAAQAVPLPPDADLLRAAALPVNYLTAWQMLEVMARVREGDVVLINGAAGGVGLAALDLCRLRGARVIGTASPAKHDFLRARGVEVVLDSRRPSFAAEVLAATGGRGCDIALEPRHGRWLGESHAALAPTGRLVMFGFSSGAPGEKPSPLAPLATLAQVPWWRLGPIRLMNDNKGVMGVNLGRLWSYPPVAVWLRELTALLAAGRLAPHVDRVFPLAEAAAAHAYLHARRNIGKVLLGANVPAQRPQTGAEAGQP